MAVGAGLLVGCEGAGGLAGAGAEVGIILVADDGWGGLDAHFCVRAFGEFLEAAEFWFLCSGSVGSERRVWRAGRVSYLLR